VRLTALYHEHVALRARLVESDGWLVPRSYEDPAAEQEALRNAAGLTDISARGKIALKGAALDAVLSAAFPGTSVPGIGRSTRPAPAETLVCYRLTAEHAVVITPPGFAAERVHALRALAAAQPCTHVVDMTGALCALRLVGPHAPGVLERLASFDTDPDRFDDDTIAVGALARVHAMIGRHDTAGLPGYDLYVDRDLGAYLWQALLAEGAPLGLAPVGLDAEDALGHTP
jgi:glycine cleavage system aminomethyltransferase T